MPEAALSQELFERETLHDNDFQMWGKTFKLPKPYTQPLLEGKQLPSVLFYYFSTLYPVVTSLANPFGLWCYWDFALGYCPWVLPGLTFC